MSEVKIEKFWRDATADDVAKVMRGEKVEARFRDPSAAWGDWVWHAVDNSHLIIAGWRDGEWFDQDGDNWTDCQVYDPPQWYLNKPDPGEGYRLLKKFPAEALVRGDQWFDYKRRDWSPSFRASYKLVQDDQVWYRRRIEPNIPEKPDSCQPYEAHAGEVIQLPNGSRLKVTHAGLEVL